MAETNLDATQLLTRDHREVEALFEKFEKASGDGAKVLINDIEAGQPDDQFYDAKVKVLQEEIEHHVREEEKMNGNMFQQARQTDVDLDALGEQMAARKAELMRLAETQGLPPAQPATLTQEA